MTTAAGGGGGVTAVAIGCWGMFRLERGPMEGCVLGVVFGLRIVGRIEGTFVVFGRRIVLRVVGAGAVGVVVVADVLGRLKGTFRDATGG